jgi:hemolysin III
LLFRHPVSATSHLLFCLWASYATLLLRRLCRADRLRCTSTAVFGLSMVFLYGASGLYHAIPARYPRAVAFFLCLDLSGIHLLIAGTCTPIFDFLLFGRLRLFLLMFIWVLALVGVAFVWILPRPIWPLDVALFVVAGAAGLVPIVPLSRAVGLAGMAWLIGGALIYLTGAGCETMRWPVLIPGVIGPHEILHFCDMGGTLCHVIFVVRFVLPFAKAQSGSGGAGRPIE